MRRRELLGSLAVVSVLPSSALGNPWAEFNVKLRELMDQPATLEVEFHLNVLLHAAADRKVILDWRTYRGPDGYIDAVSVSKDQSESFNRTWWRLNGYAHTQMQNRCADWSRKFPAYPRLESRCVPV